MSGVITLTTDFGLSSAYMAAMKGVILGINPDVTLVDICHSIEPQNIQQAAFVLSTAHQFFPPNTVHLVVVDPEVGTRRRAIILKTPEAFYVAPDNGALSYVIQSASPQPLAHDGFKRIKLGPKVEAFAITRSEFWRKPVSPTFHGRDIFAPVAARLARGADPSDFGDRVDSVIMLALPHPHLTPEGSLEGHIQHVDSFGNLITDVTSKDLPQLNHSITIEINEKMIRGVVQTYAEGEDLVALIGSSGYLEIAFKNGSAAVCLNARVGGKLTVK